MSRFRSLAVLALGVVIPSTVSCTAIFAPRDDVQRCGSADDCDPTGDARYVAECTFDEDNADLDTTQVMKVCVAAFKPIGCNPEADATSAFGMAWLDATSSSYYTTDAAGRTCADAGGVEGCPPAAETGLCDDGLEIRELGDENGTRYCQDPAKGGASYPPRQGVDAVKGQDIKDQYCRSFFCDDSFVCDEDLQCVRCDPDAELGEGGCGEVYIVGEVSRAYVDPDDACQAPNGDVDEPTFGPDFSP